MKTPISIFTIKHGFNVRLDLYDETNTVELHSGHQVFYGQTIRNEKEIQILQPDEVPSLAPFKPVVESNPYFFKKLEIYDQVLELLG